MRGEVYELKAPRNVSGHEQRGARYAVVVQSDDVLLSTWLVAPTSTSAQPSTIRPTVEFADTKTHVLVDQTTAIDPQRLGRHIALLGFDDMRRIDAALRVVLGLD